MRISPTFGGKRKYSSFSVNKSQFPGVECHIAPTLNNIKVFQKSADFPRHVNGRRFADHIEHIDATGELCGVHSDRNPPGERPAFIGDRQEAVKSGIWFLPGGGKLRYKGVASTLVCLVEEFKALWRGHGLVQNVPDPTVVVHPIADSCIVGGIVSLSQIPVRIVRGQIQVGDTVFRTDFSGNVLQGSLHIFGGIVVVGAAIYPVPGIAAVSVIRNFLFQQKR